MLFLLTLFFPAFLFNTFDFFFSQKRLPKPTKLLHPVVVATVCAVFLRLVNLQYAIPGFFLKIIQSLGALALPLIMIHIGGSMYIDFKRRGSFHWKATAMFVAAKNFIFPGLTLFFIGLFRPPESIAVLLYLQSAVPPVTAVPVLTARAGGNASLTNQFMLGSFAASIVSIPAGMLIIKGLYPGLF